MWYRASDGEERKARIKSVEHDLDLNIRTGADPDRVRRRDPEDEASEVC